MELPSVCFCKHRTFTVHRLRCIVYGASFTVDPCRRRPSHITILFFFSPFISCFYVSLKTIILIHIQPAESIALLVAFLKSGMPKNQIIIYLSIFSMMGPIGCGLGIMVNEFADPIVDSIMLAVVAGTFVYVGATEVIPEEFEDPDNKWKKFVALMSGIISIFAITQYTMTLGL
jgi:zinc transporter ZupT